MAGNRESELEGGPMTMEEMSYPLSCERCEIGDQHLISWCHRGKLELSEPLIATSPVVLSSDKPVKPEIGVPSGLERDGSDVVYPLV
jgi:hypothetical protein